MRETLGIDMSMPCGAQAGRSIDVSNKSPRDAAKVHGRLFEPRLLIARQESEPKRKLAIRSWSHAAG
ncbi:hypothetical protein, partial [Streptomyces sp. NPDC055036]